MPLELTRKACGLVSLSQIFRKVRQSLRNSIEIHGATRGQTTYTVIVDGNIQDIFGQKLGKNASLTFKVGPAEPVLVGPEQISSPSIQ